jgi:hypothetical protein
MRRTDASRHAAMRRQADPGSKAGITQGTTPHIDDAGAAGLAKETMSPFRTRTLARFVATLALAYALALQGLLGAMGGAAFAGDIRLANQLGVICTIHGPELADEADPTRDPTPGRMACIEHCTAAIAQPAVGGQGAAQPLAIVWPPVKAGWPVERDQVGPSARSGGPPPPSRGPPAV